MLHARTLGFAHPRTGERLLFQREPPDDFQAMIEALRPTSR
jgi:23S rRNA pseudouridine1911/1915/1917 synthase